MSWVLMFLRLAFSYIDRIVFGFIGTMYTLLMNIANATIFDANSIAEIGNKIYSLLGIFMLFKVSFSILTYIANPDDFMDKGKGFQSFVVNVFSTLVILVLTPWMFSQAMEIQGIILSDNIISKLFSTTTYNGYSSDNAGNSIAYDTISAFYHVDYELFSDCVGITHGSAKDEASCQSSIGSNNYSKLVETLRLADAFGNVKYYFNSDLLNAKNSNGDFVMSYSFIISTAVGVAILWMFVLFTIDIAVRTVKLGFLQIIAPIPIISRIDPRKGGEIFKKWMKEVTSTYLDLFVRLSSISLAVLIISSFEINTNVDNLVSSLFVKVFVILGSLMFAKELPKFISNMFGINAGGNFTLNPKKKMSEVPLVGKPMAGAMGAGLKLGGAALAADLSKGVVYNLGSKVVSRLGDVRRDASTRFSTTEIGQRYNGQRPTKEMNKAKSDHELGEVLYKQKQANPNQSIFVGSNATNYEKTSEMFNIALKNKNTAEAEFDKISSTPAPSRSVTEGQVDELNNRLNSFNTTQINPISPNYDATVAAEYKSVLSQYTSAQSTYNLETASIDKHVNEVQVSRDKLATSEKDLDRVKKEFDFVRSQDPVNANRDAAYRSVEDYNKAVGNLKKPIP